MTRRQVWILAGAIAFLALVASALIAGTNGLAGLAMGIAGSAFNLWALKAIIGLATPYSETEIARRKGTFLIVLAFLVKLPVFIALGLVANHLGGHAPGCFLLGLALVYLALVGWVLAGR